MIIPRSHQRSGMVLALNPDWTEAWTIKEAEEELDNNRFKFTGVGWYFSKSGEAILVSFYPVQQDSSGQTIQQDLADCTDENTKYRFDYWSSNPMTTFDWIANAPVRSDMRDKP